MNALLVAVLFIVMTNGLLFASKTVAADVPTREAKGDYVVLLHGMGRTAISMKGLEWYLSKRGYRVINVTYNSRKYSVEALAENYLRPLLDKKITDRSAKVNFVTHSLGGIIVREYFKEFAVENLGRVVMLAPPNHGSEIIDFLKAHCLTRNFLGASGRELGTSTNSLPNRLGAVQFECGIIAGDRSLNPFLSSFLCRPNDGKVTVASAKVEGMGDLLVLHSTHTWLMWRKKSLDQIQFFLRSGHFEHAT
jgi:triacylglycerol lipase